MGSTGSEHIFLLTIGACLSAITISTLVLVKVIRNHLAARKRRLKKRNSLQKYPSFVARKITGINLPVITVQNPNGSRRDSSSQQYIIAVSPPIDFYSSNLSLYERIHTHPGRAQRSDSSDSCASFSISSYSSESESEENYADINNHPYDLEPIDEYVISGMTDENNNEIFPIENRNSNKV